MKPQRITHRLKRSLALLMVLLLVFMQSAHAGNYIAFIHTDVLGSPVAVTDQNGNIVSREHVTPYGDSLGKRSADDTTAVGSSEHGIGYTGHVRDKDLGLTYMQARYYDPTIGRFMGTDPVGFKVENPGQFNRYAYVNNNPYIFTDPDGEYLQLVSWGIRALPQIDKGIKLLGGFLGIGAAVENLGPVLNEEAEETEEEKEVRGEPGKDGGVSEITKEKVDGETVSVKHTVTVDGEVVHEHIDHKGKHGSSKRFSDELTGVDTIDDGSHEPDVKDHDINHGSSQHERENPGPVGSS